MRIRSDSKLINPLWRGAFGRVEEEAYTGYYWVIVEVKGLSHRIPFRHDDLEPVKKGAGK